MPNEQTSVPLFASGEVLTAANMNISAGTGVPVFATTVTRDAAFGGTSEKVLAEGQLCYLSSTNVVQYYDGAAWATVGPATSGALVRVGGGTLSGATTTFDNVFSATYKFYLITISNGENDSNANLTFQFRYAGPTTEATGYYAGLFGFGFNATTAASGNNNSTSATVALLAGASFTGQLQVTSVDSASYRSRFAGNFSSANNNGGYVVGGENSNSRVHTGFVLGTSAGTFTAGTVNIYGYALS
jgi:hypothetical protein